MPDCFRLLRMIDYEASRLKLVDFNEMITRTKTACHGLELALLKEMDPESYLELWVHDEITRAEGKAPAKKAAPKKAPAKKAKKK